MCTQKHNAHILTHTASHPSIHFEQSDTLCSYCSALLLLFSLCVCVCFGKFSLVIFYSVSSFIYVQYQKNLWKFSSFVFWPWTRWMQIKQTQMKRWRRWRRRRRRRYIYMNYIRVTPLTFDSEIKLFRQSDWVYGCMLSLCRMCFWAPPKYQHKFFMQRWSFSSSHASVFYSVLFSTLQFSSLFRFVFYCFTNWVFIFVRQTGNSNKIIA